MTVEVVQHLSVEELEERYRKARGGIETKRTHIILLRTEGVSPSKVAEIVRVSGRTVTKVVHQYNERGPDALRDARAGNGRAPLLNEEDLAVLETLLGSPPADGGRWTGPKVTRWIEQHLGLEANSLDNARGWETLKRLGYSYKSSRPRHAKSASEEEREAWKKKAE